MIVGADSYDGAVAVVKAMPGMDKPGGCVEIQEMASRSPPASSSLAL